MIVHDERRDSEFDKSQVTILRVEDGKENHEICNHNIRCAVRDSNRVPKKYSSKVCIGLFHILQNDS
jgi:hypothetical protein